MGSERFFFMGEQPDSEMDNWFARGTRVYDGTDSVTARCPECDAEPLIPKGEERWCLGCRRIGREVRLIEANR